MSENKQPSMKYILMVGGTASRMWPISRNQLPKPFLRPNPLGGEMSVFQGQIHNLLDGGVQPEDIFVAPSIDHVSLVREQAPMIPADHIIPDPAPRDNAAAVGLATTVVDHRYPGSTIAVIWAGDHYLSKPENFVPSLKLAEKIVDRDDLIVQINVRPAAAYTHVGYVEIGQPTLEEMGKNVYQFVKHVEKPDLQTARRFYRAGNYVVHTGYRVCRAATLLKMYQQHAPDIYESLARIKACLGSSAEDQTIKEVYPEIRKESIDYAVLEHLQPEGQAVIVADLGWLDPGDFGSLYLNLPKDEVGDAISGSSDVIIKDTNNSLVIAPQGTAVAVIGLEEVAVVVTKDAVLVMDKSRAADVKRIVQELKDSGLEKYL